MFHRLRVASIVQETADAKSILLDVPASLAAEFAYRAGQFVTVEMADRRRAPPPQLLAGELARLRARPQGHGEARTRRPRLVLAQRPAPRGRRSLRHPPRGPLRARREPAAPLLLFAAGAESPRSSPSSRRPWSPRCGPSRSSMPIATRPRSSSRGARGPRGSRNPGDCESSTASTPCTDSSTTVRLRAFSSKTPIHPVTSAAPAPFMALVERALSVRGWRRTGSGSSASFRLPARGSSIRPRRNRARNRRHPEFVDVVLGGTSTGRVHRGKDAPAGRARCRARRAVLVRGGLLRLLRVGLARGPGRDGGGRRTEPRGEAKGMILACQSRPVTRRCAFRFAEG